MASATLRASRSFPQNGLNIPMKMSSEEAGGLLKKYISEQTPLLAMLQAEGVRVAISGTLSAGPVDGVPHLFVGDVENEFADSLQFRFVIADCGFAYGDLRDAKEPVKDLTNRIESFFTITARKTNAQLGLIELKSC
jgi:hypothetical protein